WCQYEALKYVSFPLQYLTYKVIAKSCKLVPVMVMGTIVSRRTYSLRQYLFASGLTFGLSLFLFSTIKNKNAQQESQISVQIMGSFLLLFYLIGDSFTSNWQSDMYYSGINSYKMMFCSSIISIVLMTFSLSNYGFGYAFHFIQNNPSFLFHLILCSSCSSIGQVFIFKCIEELGPVIFSGIMTTKSLISMLLSCIIYGHSIPLLGML
ncbi:hypothetical protein MXB_2257, partial [Myxobolus squamalis]